MVRGIRGVDPIRTSLVAELLFGAAEEMGRALERAAFSVNVRERRDFSCALFLGDGTLVAQADHIPVHLGSAPLSVRAVLEEVPLAPGDEVILNDPYRGGTHLPDVTLVRPVFLSRSRRPTFLVLNRAHHADIGGAQKGSMGLADDVYGEGLRLPPVRLFRAGRLCEDVCALFRAQVRQPDERFGDLLAQHAANEVGERRLRRLARTLGTTQLVREARRLPARAHAAVASWLRSFPRGVFRFEDVLDDDGRGSGPLPIRVAISRRGGRLRFDFTGTAAQTRGPVNANRAVTLAAVAYVVRCLVPEAGLQNEGVLRAVDLVTRPGTLVDARAPAAVAGGNVETSQRIVDVAFGALARALPDVVPAASAGTMANLSLGDDSFAHYETLAGGSGATPRRAGASVVQTHMTNTRNTSIEALESLAPVRVERLAVRRGSGGAGSRRGGDGQVKEIVALAGLDVSWLADRAGRGPYGLAGGGPGRPLVVSRIDARGRRRLPGKGSCRLAPGERLRIETPGGGGHGRAR